MKPSSPRMQVAAVQLDIKWEDRSANHSRVLALLEREPPLPGSLLVLPEMFATGFSMNVDRVAQSEAREDERFLEELCRRLGVWCVAGTVTRGQGERGRNEAVAVDPSGRLVARYCKLHPFSPGAEDRHYEAGNEIVLFPCNRINVAPFICYDLRFPEIFRAAARRGAQVMPVIANWPDTRAEQRMILLRARAIENQSYVIGVNRVGDDPKLHYAGQTVIIGPRGDVLAQADDRETVLSAELDLDALLEFRRTTPWLRDMRSDFLAE